LLPRIDGGAHFNEGGCHGQNAKWGADFGCWVVNIGWWIGARSFPMMNFGLNSALLIQKFRSLCAPFGGEAVFLQAAIGFVGNGAFDEGGGEGGRKKSEI
jgi:hypothetical protein